VAAAHSDVFARVIPRRLLRPRPLAWGEVPLHLEAGVGSLHHLDSELLQVTVTPGSRLHGIRVWELRLPAGVTLGLLARDGSTRALARDTVLRVGDVLLVFTRPELRLAAQRQILAVHRAGRLAEWRGESGE
jgi:NhaP-type Na+/H+ and K+/H+ antiporter